MMARPPYIVKRLEVADREVAAAEQLELQHRLRRAALVCDERGERDETACERNERRGAAPAVVRLLDQREHDPAEAERAEQRADVVDLPSVWGAIAGTAAKISTRVAATSGTLRAKTQRQSS